MNYYVNIEHNEAINNARVLLCNLLNVLYTIIVVQAIMILWICNALKEKR